jgi:hypothetical protein
MPLRPAHWWWRSVSMRPNRIRSRGFRSRRMASTGSAPRSLASACRRSSCRRAAISPTSLATTSRRSSGDLKELGRTKKLSSPGMIGRSTDEIKPVICLTRPAKVCPTGQFVAGSGDVHSQADIKDKSALSKSLTAQQCAYCSLEGRIEKDTTVTIFRISFLTILLLTGCENKRVETPVAGQIQQIESPLQNTAEGMAKAKAYELERSRVSNLPAANPRIGNPLF